MQPARTSLLRSGVRIAGDFLREYPLQLSLAFVFILVSGFLEGIGIIVLLPLLDLLTGSLEDASQITQALADVFQALDLPVTTTSVVLVLIGVVLVKSVLLLSAEFFVGSTIATIISDFRLSLIGGLTTVRWPFFTAEPIGKLTNTIITETTESSKSARALVEFASVSLQALVYLGVALLLSWQLTVAGVFAGAIMAALLNIFVTISRREATRQKDLMRSYTGRLVDWLNGIKPIKAMSLEGRITPYLRGETLDLLSVQRRLILASSAMAKMQEPIAAVFIGVGLIAAIELFSVSTNALLVMAVLFVRAIGQIGAIQKALRKFATTEPFYLAYRDNMARIVDEAETIDRPRAGGAPEPARFERSIEVRDASYAYDSHQVLDRLSLTIKAGTVTSVVGPSGSGKSTLLDMIAGLLKPQGGSVLIDGVDLRSMTLRDWRQQIGYVPQETVLLHATVRENLTLGDPAITEADLAAALAAADAEAFVADLPEGLDTMVGERGLKVSGGQRQRLAVARALVRRPKLLLLDEATSALDQDSEQTLCQRLAELVPPLTIVAISHRPAIEAVADETYRLESGRLTQCEPGALSPTSNAQGASA